MNPFFQSRRFIVLLALLMGITALSIDAILPAFPEISQTFGLTEGDENRIQLMVIVFMLGFSLTQLLFGVLADVFGRKIILTTGLIIYILASILAIFATNYETLLIARLFQGIGVGAPRVLTLAIVRDVVSGRAMSRLMSLIMMVFLIIPIIAPMLGQWIISLGDWVALFIFFALIATLACAWELIELPETLPTERRNRFSIKSVANAIKTCLSDSITLLYLLILGCLFGMLVLYISQFEPIFQDGVYHLGENFVYIFACIALSMVASSIANSRLVLHKGLRSMVKIALTIMVISDSALLIAALLTHGKPPLFLVIALFMLHFLGFSTLMPNFNSLIIELYKNIAGTASALIGSVMTIIGIGIAHIVGQQFNETLYPISLAYFILAIIIAISTYWIFTHSEEQPD